MDEKCESIYGETETVYFAGPYTKKLLISKKLSFEGPVPEEPLRFRPTISYGSLNLLSS